MWFGRQGFNGFCCFQHWIFWIIYKPFQNSSLSCLLWLLQPSKKISLEMLSQFTNIHLCNIIVIDIFHAAPGYTFLIFTRKLFFYNTLKLLLFSYVKMIHAYNWKSSPSFLLPQMQILATSILLIYNDCYLFFSVMYFLVWKRKERVLFPFYPTTILIYIFCLPLSSDTVLL